MVQATLAFRSLYNGRTLHGVEFLSPKRACFRPPTTVPIGRRPGSAAVGTTPRHVGLVGLGVGTLAAYGRPGDSFRFYEINPAVIQIASRYFHFLDGSPAKTEVILGDGRLALEKEPSGEFRCIRSRRLLGRFDPGALDDERGLRHLLPASPRDGGVLAIHLTNRYLDLDPVVDALAASFQKRVTHIHSQPTPPSISSMPTGP